MRLRATLLLCVLTAPLCAAPQSEIEVGNIEYLEGVPGQAQKARGSLRISAAEISFVVGGRPQFTIPGRGVDYVAAQAQASMLARTADVGMATIAIAASAVFAPAYPLVFLFHKAEKHLLSIEYLEGEERVRRLVLFDVHDHSALAVKKMIDDRLGFTLDYYRDKDRQEEERKRQAEAAATPAGTWETPRNAVVGDVQYDRYLLESGRYSILIFDRYIGFRPEGQEWAKYRIPLRGSKEDKTAGSRLEPVLKSSRLVGFRYEGKEYVFY